MPPHSSLFFKHFGPSLKALKKPRQSTTHKDPSASTPKHPTGTNKCMMFTLPKPKTYHQHTQHKMQHPKLLQKASIISQKSLEDKTNDRFASAEDELEEKSSKGWKKLDETLKKIILFASSTDGESAATQPTERLKALINTKNGALVARLINSWHDLDIVVQTGMASNIQKGCIISSNGPFSINTFSPFFVPAVRAGFNILSHDELNCLDFASQSNNLTSKDIKKMVYSHPYVPTEPYLFIAQIQNFHAVLSNCLGDKSLIAISIKDVISHYSKNELLYYNIFA
jgi:hypothetical protein